MRLSSDNYLKFFKHQERSDNMPLSQPSIILITGIMAAGKSTSAQQLAERLPRSVHLRGDSFRRMIVNGRADLGGPDFPEEAFAQLRLRYEIAAQAAAMYGAAGFTVVYQDIIIGAILSEVVGMLQKSGLPVYVVVLCPAPDVVAEREAARSKTGYTGWTPVDLDHELRANTPHLGLWLDTSALSVDASVDALLEQIDLALIE
jgi:predicted kinase